MAKGSSKAVPTQAKGFPLLSLTILVGLFALAVDALHLQLGRIGWDDMSAPFRDPADKRLRKNFTGVAPIDGFLQIVLIMFEPITNGEMPELTLYGFQFAGQVIPVVTVLIVQGMREGNRRNILRFPMFWGLLMQGGGYGCVIPLYFILNLLFFSSDPKASQLRDPAQLHAVIPAFTLGYILPTVLQSLPLAQDLHQILLAVWQPFPVYVGVFLWIFSGVVKSVSIGGSSADSKTTLDRKALDSAYGFAVAVGALTHWITFGVLLVANLSPDVFPAGIAGRLTPADVFVPYSPHSYGPATIPHGAKQFLQYDQYIGATAGLVWAATLANQSGVWPASVGNMLQIVKDVVLLGPPTAVVSLLWKRDQAIFKA